MKKGTVYCCSDIHGFYEGYAAIKNFIKPEDKVYCLGDCGDRGPESWKTITAVYNDPQFIYLKGNHEDMLVKAIREWQPEHINDHDYQLLIMNGGYDTFNSWKKSSERNNWCNRLAKLPLIATYEYNDIKFILSHAGFTPPNIPSDELLLWDRYHFNEKWPENENNTIIIHGHTPVVKLNYKNNRKIYRYCNGHKIDIDLGTIRTHSVALLNLHTLEPIYFEV